MSCPVEILAHIVRWLGVYGPVCTWVSKKWAQAVNCCYQDLKLCPRPHLREVLEEDVFTRIVPLLSEKIVSALLDLSVTYFGNTRDNVFRKVQWQDCTCLCQFIGRFGKDKLLNKSRYWDYYVGDRRNYRILCQECNTDERYTHVEFACKYGQTTYLDKIHHHPPDVDFYFTTSAGTLSVLRWTMKKIQKSGSEHKKSYFRCFLNQLVCQNRLDGIQMLETEGLFLVEEDATSVMNYLCVRAMATYQLDILYYCVPKGNIDLQPFRFDCCHSLAFVHYLEGQGVVYTKEDMNSIVERGKDEVVLYFFQKFNVTPSRDLTKRCIERFNPRSTRFCLEFLEEIPPEIMDCLVERGNVENVRYAQSRGGILKPEYIWRTVHARKPKILQYLLDEGVNVPDRVKVLTYAIQYRGYGEILTILLTAIPMNVPLLSALFRGRDPVDSWAFNQVCKMVDSK